MEKKREQKAFSGKPRVRTMAHERKVREVKGGEDPDGSHCVDLRLATALKGKGTEWTGGTAIYRTQRQGQGRTGGEGVRG